MNLFLNAGYQPLPSFGKESNAMDAVLEYHWNTGSIPPPDYYEYVITIGPGLQGEICLRPDYPESDPPSWKEPIAVSDEAYTLLLNLARKCLASRAPEELHIGGSYETLRFSGQDGQPANISVANAEGRQLADAMKDLVPQSTWQRLFDRFEAYRDSR